MNASCFCRGGANPGAARAERRLLDIVASSTILRCAWFHQNFSESFLLDPVRDGVIALPVSDVVEPFLDADDIADVALRCLTDPSRAGQTLELTGPELLSFARVAALLDEVTGHDVMFVPVSADDYVEGAVGAGIDRAEAKAFAELFSTVTDRRNAHLTGDVEAVLGRPASTFASYARVTAATGVWDR